MSRAWSGCVWCGGQRIWRCSEAACARGTFAEQIPTLVGERGSLTTRAITWAIGQLRREHATIAGLARRLEVAGKTLWRAIKPELVRLSRDESRFAGVRSLGVDEQLRHHVEPRRRGPKELTGMATSPVTPTPAASRGCALGCWTWCRAVRRRPTPTGLRMRRGLNTSSTTPHVGGSRLTES